MYFWLFPHIVPKTYAIVEGFISSLFCASQQVYWSVGLALFASVLEETGLVFI